MAGDKHVAASTIEEEEEVEVRMISLCDPFRPFSKPIVLLVK